MKTALLAALTGAAIMLGAQSGSAESADDLKALRKDVEGLKESLKTVQSDLREIKTLLRGRLVGAPGPAPAAPAPLAQQAVLSLEGAPARGEKAAKVAMVEFTDYQ